MILNGSDLMVFLKDDSANTYHSMAYATNHTLEISGDSKETSTKDNGCGLWQDSEITMMSWSINSENLVADGSENGKTYTDMFDAMVAREKLDVVFAISGNHTNADPTSAEYYTVPDGGWSPKNDGNIYYQGKVLITSLSLNAQNGEKASFSATLTGCGALTKKN